MRRRLGFLTFRLVLIFSVVQVMLSCGNGGGDGSGGSGDTDTQTGDSDSTDPSDDDDDDNDDDDNDNDDDTDSETGTETDTILDPDVDAMTSATPTVESGEIDEGHGGWRNADCVSCHPEFHNDAGYANPECVTCHGSNGAPQREPGHDNSNCPSCHVVDDIHPGLDFAPPSDCRSCHRYAKPDDGSCAHTESTFDVVVIGAGGGGLSAAAYLAKMGMNVLVLERHYKAGGYMVSFDRGEYRFEASLHGFDGLDPTVFDAVYGDRTGANVDLLERLGIYEKVKPVRCDPMYKAYFPLEEHHIDVPADSAAYIAMLKELFPDEASGIDAMYQEMSNIDRVMRVIFRYQNEGKDISGIDSVAFIAEVTLKGLMSTLTTVQDYMNNGESLSSFLAKYVEDQQLIAVWTQLAGFLGGSPDNIPALYFIVMWNNYHFGGYYYFEGGSQSVIDALIEALEENGGEIRYNTTVSKIDISSGLAATVRTEDGECFNADFVVSNANARATMIDMVGAEYLPEDPESPFYPAKLSGGNEESLAVGMSMFQVYLGVDHDYRELFGGGHEVMLSESYDQAENFASYANSEVDEVSYAIIDYTAVDPGNAPEGKNVIVLGTILMYDWEEKWHWADSHSAYQQFKEETAMRLVERAEADFLPGLTQHIEVMEIGSPQTMRGFTLSLDGSIFGWDARPSQCLTNRLPQQTPIDNLLLTGAWTSPGGGQSAVMISGLLAGMEILKK